MAENEFGKELTLPQPAADIAIRRAGWLIGECRFSLLRTEKTIETGAHIFPVPLKQESEKIRSPHRVISRKD
ncbi:MAG: hypothetical protein AB2L11_00615 [Syntrophobacteraceae bacterium]